MQSPRPSVRALLTFAAITVAASAQSVLTQGQVVLAEGDPVAAVPGAVIGGTASLDLPMIDLDGNVLVRARMTGGGVVATDDRAYFLGRTKDDLQMVVRSGMADPTVGNQLGVGTTLNTATGTGITGSPRISPTGKIIMFSATLSGPSVVTTGTAATGRNDTCLLVGTPNALNVLARRGASFTTISNGLTYQFDTAFSMSQQSTAMNQFGTACFSATVIGGDVSGTTNNLGWVTGQPGNYDWVIRKGDIITIPGGNNPGTYAMHTALGFNCAINLVGQVLHDERLLTTGTPPGSAVLATSTTDNCIFLYTPGGGNALLVREGDQAAGLAPGVLYGSPTMSQGFGINGRAGFACSLTGAVTAGVDDQAIFLGDVGSLQPAVVRGQTAPGTGGATFNTLFSTFGYSDYLGGSVVFYSTLAGTANGLFDDSSFWIASPGSATPLTMIAREGDPAPGFSGIPGFVSATFGNTTTGTANLSPGNMLFNDRGQVIFSNVAVSVTDGAGTTFPSCTYCWDPTTGLKLLFAPGDQFSTVAGLTTGNSTGGLQFPSGESSTLGLNSDGDLVQRVNFTTGGAIVRAKLGALDCGPSALSATLGGLHTMKLDAGIGNAGGIYVVVASVSGTRPGFAFGGKQIPLNFDAVTTESINGLTFFPGTPWGTTLGLLDGNGRGTATFTMPPALPVFAGTDIDHAMAVIDLALNVGFVSPPCGVLLY